MIYQFINTYHFKVDLVCDVLKVSRSGYYAAIGRPLSCREKSNVRLLHLVKTVHMESKETYGLPRMVKQLSHMGESCGKNRVHRLMKLHGIHGLLPRKFKVTTTDSKHNLPIASRVFQTENPLTHPTKPNQVWAGDISYIFTREGLFYLAIVLDVFTRKIVGFSMQNHMKTDLIKMALTMAIGRQKILPNQLIGHTDRGSQYASESYREELKMHGIIPSMSRTANCYDNAYAETFFATLKKELIYRKEYETIDQGKKEIFEYIEVWYNQKRLHSSIGYLSPIQFEKSLAA